MTDWTFRSATGADWLAIADLLQSAALPLDGAQEHLDNFILTFENGVLVGVAGVERYEGVGLLRSVAVKDRNKGLGYELVQRAIKQSRSAGLGSLVLLTTTAEAYFPRFGFRQINRDDVPAPVQASAEFQGACPDTAVAMRLSIW